MECMKVQSWTLRLENFDFVLVKKLTQEPRQITKNFEINVNNIDFKGLHGQIF